MNRRRVRVLAFALYDIAHRVVEDMGAIHGVRGQNEELTVVLTATEAPMPAFTDDTAQFTSRIASWRRRQDIESTPADAHDPNLDEIH